MRKLFKRRPSPAFAVAVTALFVALAGTGVAQQAVTALSKKEKKQTRNISKKEANKRINARAPGLTVGNASKLDNKEILYASVNGNGTLRSGSPGVGSAAGGAGIYSVTFPRALGTCPVVASPQGGSQILVDETAGAAGDALVGIFTFNGAGALTASRFDVIAYC